MEPLYDKSKIKVDNSLEPHKYSSEMTRTSYDPIERKHPTSEYKDSTFFLYGTESSGNITGLFKDEAKTKKLDNAALKDLLVAYQAGGSIRVKFGTTVVSPVSGTDTVLKFYDGTKAYTLTVTE